MRHEFLAVAFLASICPKFAFCDIDGRLARCEPYRATVERVLSENGVSTDYYYLMVAESGCRESAKSSKGALGFWQMMPATGRAHGCDDLRDLECATNAAASYIMHLSRRFSGDDIIAAYNMGGHKYSRIGMTADARGLIQTSRKLKKQDEERCLKTDM